MKRITIIILILFLFAGPVFAQDTPEVEIKKNSVYGTIGVFVVYYNALINYERIVWEPDVFFARSISLRAGIGWWETWVSQGVDYVITVSALTGKKALHLEYGIGVAYSPAYANDLYLLPAGNIGFRFQKPGGSLLFRIGAGVPEIAYVSLGCAF